MKYSEDDIEAIMFPTTHSLDKDFSICNWRRLSLFCFDFESTDRYPTRASTQMIQFYGKTIVGLDKTVAEFGTLIHTDTEIQKEASSVHHIYKEDLVGAPCLEDVLEKIYKNISNSDLLVAYNGLSFDFPLLLRDLANHGYDISNVPPMFDPIVIFRYINGKYSASRQLDAAAHYKIFDQIGNVAHGESSLHDAKTDVNLLIGIVRKMMNTDAPWNVGRLLDVQRNEFLKQSAHRVKQFGEKPFNEWLQEITDACNGIYSDPPTEVPNEEL